MEVVLLGTGSPVPLLDRAGTSTMLNVDGERLLVDCGPRTVYRLLEHEVNPGAVEHLLFTHQHMDHNASFFHFAIAGWSVGGRDELTVYGPENTSRLLEALEHVYEEDIEYRQQVGYSGEGIDDIEFVCATPSFEVTIGDVRVSACPVEHSIETYAYRFDDTQTGASVVISADTKQVQRLADFATGADILIHEACIAPVDNSVSEEDVMWSEFAEPMNEGKRDRLAAVHASASEAGEIASSAGVETLVLNHLLPYRDIGTVRRQAESTFDGRVVVAEDGDTVTP
ncbi:MBL fold metallo-hydrolase [Halobacterium sp. R2-5]|uniref:MBL fold metallo-hydrolase n=1 Tax=Halobacterium sp. R2-5 TaxID=2715751 RepID=UPI001AAE70DA|nr:MBL fold metallo-hydrolase [Halobacterium sp. R2-5]